MPNECKLLLNLKHADHAVLGKAQSSFEQGTFLKDFVPCAPDALSQIDNWGTKWDISHVQILKSTNKLLQVEAMSANDPPLRALHKLKNQGFQIVVHYCEPGFDYCGTWNDGSDRRYSIQDDVGSIPANLEHLFQLSQYREIEDEESWEE